MFEYFYNEILRRTIISFGTLFNNISIKHKDSSDETVSVVKIPLAYGPTQKFLARIEQQANLNKSTQMSLPRMSFEFTDLVYDPTRKSTQTQQFVVKNSSGSEIKKGYVPVPYNIGFEVGIIAKSQDDGLQILEQILPFFQPSLNVSIKFIPDMDEIRDVAFVLNSVNMEDDWEDDFTTRRSITYTLSFTAKSYIYGPYTKADVIRKARVIETIGDLNVNKRHVELSYTPKATVDYNQDGQVDAADDQFVVSTDDFGFNEGMEFL